MRKLAFIFATFLMAVSFFSTKVIAESVSIEPSVYHLSVPLLGRSGDSLWRFPTSADQGGKSYMIIAGNDDGLLRIDARIGTLCLLNHQMMTEAPRVLVLKEVTSHPLKDDAVAQEFRQHALEFGVADSQLIPQISRELLLIVTVQEVTTPPSRQLIDNQSLASDSPPVIVEMYSEPSLLRSPLVLTMLPCGTLSQVQHSVGRLKVQSLKPFAAPVITETEPAPSIEQTPALPTSQAVANTEASTKHTSVRPSLELNKPDAEEQSQLTPLIQQNSKIAKRLAGLLALFVVLFYAMHWGVRRLLQSNSQEDEANPEADIQEDADSTPQAVPERMFMAFTSDEDVHKLRQLLTAHSPANVSANTTSGDSGLLDEVGVGLATENSQGTIDLNLTQEFSDLLDTKEEFQVEAYEIAPEKRKLLDQTAEFRLIANTAATSAIQTYWISRSRNLIFTIIGAGFVSASGLLLFLRDTQSLLFCCSWSILTMAAFLVAARRLKKRSN